ncbi:MAG: hypothetical protein PUG10_05265 [Lachnospiraceae bacterium]|nr:hypothetical protein [Lachnospiraceae bacterium]
MSKKCCKITYSDSDTYCKVCGKYLGDSVADIFGGDGNQNDVDLFDYSNVQSGYSAEYDESADIESDEEEIKETDVLDKQSMNRDDENANNKSSDLEDNNKEPEVDEHDADSYEEDAEELEYDNHEKDETDSKESDGEESEDGESEDGESEDGESEDRDLEDEDDLKASGVKKFFGASMIILTICATAIVGVGIYMSYFAENHLSYQNKKAVEYPSYENRSEDELKHLQGILKIVATYTDADEVFSVKEATNTDATSENVNEEYEEYEDTTDVDNNAETAETTSETTNYE